MNLQFLTAAFVSINLVSLWSEIPSAIIAFSFFVLVLGFIAQKFSFQNILKTVLLFLAIVLIRFSFQKVSSAEGAISFVLILSTLKFWELKSDYDHFNMFLILCLSEAGIFLLNPTFLIFFLGCLKILFYFYYILKLRNYDLSSISFKRLLLLILPSLIFALILFYTFPRFTQGFLNTAGNLQVNQTGISDVIDIKSLGPLNLSSKKVFKVYLDNSDLRPSTNTYWRQNVLWNYYDGAWRSGERNLEIQNNEDLKVLISSNKPLRFVMEETTSQEFITLDGHQPLLLDNNLTTNPVYYLDQTIRSRSSFKPLTQYFLQYGTGPLQSYTNNFISKKAMKIKIQETDIIAIKNKFLNNVMATDPASLKLQKLKNNFIKNKFLYSLNPPTYKSTEDFLLNGKSGYCSHFASAFGVLARLSGIPTRLVSGFLGSEYNNFDNSIIVKELDAHVWLEVFLENGKWVRVDPTELVSPARLQLSAQDFNNQISTLPIPRLEFITSIGLWVDAINSKFNESIYGFDQDAQVNLFRFELTKNVKPYEILFVGFSLGLVVFYLLYFFKNRSIPKHIRRYNAFLKQMKKYKLEKLPYETATQFMERALLEKNVPENYIKEETSLYIKTEYLS